MVLIKWALAHGYSLSEYVFRVAVKLGHFDMMMVIRSDKPPTTCVAAARGGQLALLQWGGSWPDHDRMCNAIEYCGLSGLSWTRVHGLVWDGIVWDETSTDNFVMLKWALANGFQWNSRIQSVVMSLRDFDMRMWAYFNGEGWNGDEHIYAESCLSTLQWMKLSGYPPEIPICAYMDNLDTLRWLGQRGYKHNSNV